MSNLEQITSALDATLPANTATRGADPNTSIEALMFELRMSILSCPIVLDYMSYLSYRESVVSLESLKQACLDFCREFVFVQGRKV